MVVSTVTSKDYGSLKITHAAVKIILQGLENGF